ncbi:MAG: hypothetical protein GEU26_10330 [Nitrososphaeraceae archaeon]|nr:hypothetical protein [Nitrososphaeraceae archaeon]
MSSPLLVEQILSLSSTSQNANWYRYSKDEDETLLLDEAEQAYNRIVNAITNDFINGMPTDIESAYHIPQVPNVNDDLSTAGGGANHEIFDTRDLSQVNFLYNDITFQVYPGLKITNERISKTNNRLREDESESCDLLYLMAMNDNPSPL